MPIVTEFSSWRAVAGVMKERPPLLEAGMFSCPKPWWNLVFPGAHLDFFGHERAEQSDIKNVVFHVVFLSLCRAGTLPLPQSRCTACGGHTPEVSPGKYCHSGKEIVSSIPRKSAAAEYHNYCQISFKPSVSY